VTALFIAATFIQWPARSYVDAAYIGRSRLYFVAESDGHSRCTRRSDQQASRQSGRVQSVSGRIQDRSRVCDPIL